MKASGWTDAPKFDYSQVTKNGPPPLEPGVYKCRILEASPQATKEKKPMIKLVVEAFENADGEKLSSPRRVFDNLVLSQAALFRVVILSDALGIDPLPGGSVEEAEEFCAEVTSASKSGVFASIKIEEYTGKDGSTQKRNQIARWLTEEEASEATSTGSAASPSESNGTSTGARRPRGKTPTEVAAS